jgi:hypothetical protein
MNYKYEKYYLPIILFSLFVVLIYSQKNHEGFDNGPIAAKPSNQLLQTDADIKCYDYEDETKEKQYTLYEYMKPGFIPMDNNYSDIDVNNGEENVTIVPCKRVRLKNFKNNDNTRNGDPNDYKYALSLYDIKYLDACDFDDNKHPFTNMRCEGFTNFIQNVDEKYDAVDLLYIVFLMILTFIIFVKFSRKWFH